MKGGDAGDGGGRGGLRAHAAGGLQGLYTRFTRPLGKAIQAQGKHGKQAQCCKDTRRAARAGAKEAEGHSWEIECRCQPSLLTLKYWNILIFGLFGSWWLVKMMVMANLEKMTYPILSGLRLLAVRYDLDPDRIGCPEDMVWASMEAVQEGRITIDDVQRLSLEIFFFGETGEIPINMTAKGFAMLHGRIRERYFQPKMYPEDGPLIGPWN